MLRSRKGQVSFTQTSTVTPAATSQPDNLSGADEIVTLNLPLLDVLRTIDAAAEPVATLARSAVRTYLAQPALQRTLSGFFMRRCRPACALQLLCRSLVDFTSGPPKAKTGNLRAGGTVAWSSSRQLHCALQWSLLCTLLHPTACSS
jgi:hypothetical protein